MVKKKNESKYCINCGSILEKKATYCIKCGSEVDKVNPVLIRKKQINYPKKKNKVELGFVIVLCFLFFLVNISIFINGFTLTEIQIEDKSNVVALYSEHVIDYSADIIFFDNDDFIFKSSDNSIAEVKDGIIYPLKEGTFTLEIISKEKEDVKITKDYDVKYVGVESIKLSGEKQVSVGGTSSIKYELFPLENSNLKLNWSSSNTEVINVDDNGKIKTLSVGSATIKLTAENGVMNTIKIDVIIPVEKLIVDSTSIKLEKGKTKDLNVTIMPEEATDKTITWTSSKPKVATVQDGKVKAIKKGKTVITAVSTNGKKVSIDVEVVEKKSADSNNNSNNSNNSNSNSNSSNSSATNFDANKTEDNVYENMKGLNTSQRKNFANALKECKMDPTKVKDIVKKDDWMNGPRYSFSYLGHTSYLYMNDDTTVNTIRYTLGGVALYDEKYVSLDYNDFYLSSSLAIDLEVKSESIIDSYLVDASSAKYDWNYHGRSYDFYKLSGTVTANNYYGQKVTNNIEVAFRSGNKSMSVIYVSLNNKIVQGTYVVSPEIQRVERKVEDNSTNSVITINAGVLGNYGKYDKFDGEKYIRYYLPNGKYKVTALTKNSMFYIESIKIYKEDGYDTVTTYKTVKLSKSGDTDTIEIKSGQCISLVDNSKLKFELIK